jgi:tRNA (adenine57-N1/adenine58-N1)-methyltransferase catalytic subunit
MKAILPTGRLFTFEFNADRVVKAKVDFKRLGLDNYVTVTHRDVLSNGFTLQKDSDEKIKTGEENEARVAPGSIDAIFLDLPSPHVAVPHAYEVLRKRGRLCNFSPCIE